MFYCGSSVVARPHPDRRLYVACLYTPGPLNSSCHSWDTFGRPKLESEISNLIHLAARCEPASSGDEAQLDERTATKPPGSVGRHARPLELERRSSALKYFQSSHAVRRRMWAQHYLSYDKSWAWWRSVDEPF